MFSGMKMEKFIESEHSGIFPIELVTKNVVPQSLGIHFMHIILICYGLILICARIRRFILFLRILLRLWRSKDFPILEVFQRIFSIDTRKCTYLLIYTVTILRVASSNVSTRNTTISLIQYHTLTVIQFMNGKRVC